MVLFTNIMNQFKKTISYQFEAKTIVEQGRISQVDVDAVHNWLSKTSLSQVPKEVIVVFLLACNNVVTKTQSAIWNYYKLKNEIPEFFTDRDIDNKDLSDTCKVVSAVNLPVRIPPNTAVQFYKLKNCDYTKLNLLPAVKLTLMLMANTQISNPPDNLVVIADMKGCGIMHSTRLQIDIVKKCVNFAQDAMPIRLKQVHVLNTTSLFYAAYNISKVFIRKEKLEALERIMQLHPEGANALEFISADYLPEDYGGNLPSSDELHDKQIDNLRQMKQFFDEEEKFQPYPRD